ncbi:MAG TPA: flagellar hook assembly protein FlgD [Thermotogota bacterium]|nr:flagellar hook assembly protein FlgD [Thermotogota bacterium]HPJ90236.1 flagellar hook assembly protein FlgD [Thermotogota bacterium]HPR97315.1 flagellar hook assembly protein FlgD [Thermotogota bacterium]
MSVDGVNNYSNLFTNTTNSSSDNSNTLDKDAFLKLLVAEIQNQNPLEPMDNQKFLDQMTQFSTMEQMTNMSQSFQNYIESVQSTTKLQASAVVGKYAVIETNTIRYEDDYAEGIVYNVEDPGTITIRIKDSDGKIVREEEIGYKDTGIYGYQWDGRNGSGTLQEEGTYFYELLSVDANGQETSFGGVDGGLVEAVQFIDDSIYVVINDNQYNFESIIEITEEPENTEET